MFPAALNMRRARSNDGGDGGATADRQIADTQFIDVLADTQSEQADLAVDAGISDFHVLYQNGKVTLPVSLTIQTSTGRHRGVHMSRLVQAGSSSTPARGASGSIESWLRSICREVNATQPGAKATCSLEVPYADQFIPVSIEAGERGAIRYQFTAKGMTACPCSKKMIGIGHMQRAEIVMITESSPRTRRGLMEDEYRHDDGSLNVLKVIEKMEECFSAVPTERLKRVDEAKKILYAQENARFAEDLIRECVRRFPSSLYIRSRCFESIHAHDAMATWSRRPGWVPSLLH